MAAIVIYPDSSTIIPAKPTCCEIGVFVHDFQHLAAAAFCLLTLVQNLYFVLLFSKFQLPYLYLGVPSEFGPTYPSAAALTKK